MGATAPAGTRVLVEPLAARARAGDVVLLAGSIMPLLHRVLVRLPFGFLVHGGDLPGARAGLARDSVVLGRAALPRRVPTVARRLRALLEVSLPG
jgi:hypothetical protein